MYSWFTVTLAVLPRISDQAYKFKDQICVRLVLILYRAELSSNSFQIAPIATFQFFLKAIFTNFPHKMFRFTATISLCFQQVEITPAFSIVNVLTLSTLANNAQDDLQRRSPGVSFQYFSQITITLEISLFSWWGGWPSWLGQYYDYSGSLLKWRWIHLLKADYKINDV